MKPIAVDHTAEEAKECIGIVEQALEDATNSEIFICGMQPLDEGSPCHDIFQCDPSLTCATPVESDFYKAGHQGIGGSRGRHTGPQHVRHLCWHIA